MQLVLERRAERSTLIAVASPLIAFALTVVTPAEESLLTVNHRPPTRGQHAPARRAKAISGEATAISV
jgi:hypothetical protein